MDQISILMADGCSKNEAKRHLKNGTLIFDKSNFVSNFETYMSEWDADEEMYTGLKMMIEKDIPYRDWGVVCINGVTYYIMYIL